MNNSKPQIGITILSIVGVSLLGMTARAEEFDVTPASLGTSNLPTANPDGTPGQNAFFGWRARDPATVGETGLILVVDGNVGVGSEWRDLDQLPANDVQTLTSLFDVRVDLEGEFGARDPQDSQLSVEAFVSLADYPYNEAIHLQIGNEDEQSLTMPTDSTDTSGDIPLTQQANNRFEGTVTVTVQDITDILDDDGTVRVRGGYRDGDNHNSLGVTDDVFVTVRVLYVPGTLLDTTAPTGSLSIGTGAPFLNQTSVTLNTSATDSESGVDVMRFRNESGPFSAWETYATSKTWSLSSGEGQKTVTVEYRDVAGNVGTAAANVTLDQTAPTGSLVIDGGAAFATSASVTLGITGSDALSGVASMRFGDGTMAGGSWETFAVTRNWTLPGDEGSKTVALELQDAAGNVSTAQITDSIVLDRAAPTLGVSIAGGAPYSTPPDVTVTVSFDDAVSGTIEYRLREPTGAFGPWTAVASSPVVGVGTLDVSHTFSGADGTRSVEVEVRDAAGNVSESVADDVFLDTVDPTGEFELNSSAIYVTPWDEVVAATESSDDGGSGIAWFRYRVDGAEWSEWQPASTTQSFILDRPVLSTGRRVDIDGMWRDAAGRESAIFTRPIHLVGTDSPDLAAAKKFGGFLSDGRDVDAYEIDMIPGETLTIRVKLPKFSSGAVLDLYDTDHSPLSFEVWPFGKSQKFVFTAEKPTGTVLLVVRAADSTAFGVSYSARREIKAGRDLLVPRGESSGDVFDVPFDAVAGTRLKVNLLGVTSMPNLLAPSGRSSQLFGKLKFRKGRGLYVISGRNFVTLDETGTWHIVGTGDGGSSVSYRLTLTPPGR